MEGGRGVVQNRESPDFRSPEVGRYAINTQNIHFISPSFGTVGVQEKQALGRHYKGDFKTRTVNCCSLRQEE